MAEPIAGMPSVLVAVLARGLQRRADDRFESMDALLQAMTTAGRGRARWWWGAAAVVALAGGATALAFESPTTVEPCHAAPAELAGLWDDARRSELVAQLEQSGAPTDRETAARVALILDEYVDRWAALHARTCELQRSAEGEADLLLDRSMDCLHRRRVALAAVVDRLSEGDAAARQSAVEASLGLPSVDACEDRQTLLQHVAPPEDPAVAAEVETMREALARAEALRMAGDEPKVLEITTALVPRVRQLGYPPLTAEAFLVHGRALADPAAAEDLLEAAYFAAGEAGDWELAGQAATALVVAVGTGLRRHEDGLAWVDHAEAARQRQGRAIDAALLAAKASVLREQGELESAAATYQRALQVEGGPTPGHQLQLASIHEGLAQVLIDQAHFDDAMEHLRRAEAMLQTVLGPHHPRVADVRVAMGDAMRAAGDLQGAVELHRRALADVVDGLGAEHRVVAHYRSGLAQSLMRVGAHKEALAEATKARASIEKSFVADHPDVAKAHALVGMIHAQLGRYDEALECFARARTILETALDPEHPSVTDILERITMVHFQQRRFDRALPVMLEILERQERTYGPEHPAVARAESDLGIIYMNLSDDAAAVPHLTRALELGERTLDPDHPSNALAHANLADALTNVGDYEGAVAHLDRALAIQEQALGDSHRDVAFSLKARSSALSKLQRHQEARADAARSVAIYSRIDARPAERGAAHFRLGEALWELRGEQASARAEVLHAREDYLQAGEAQADRVAAADEWLATH